MILDEFFHKIPNQNSIDERIRNLIFESISINTSYSSMIEVSQICLTNNFIINQFLIKIDM